MKIQDTIDALLSGDAGSRVLRVRADLDARAPEDWRTLAAVLAVLFRDREICSVAVAGGQGSGKSTLAELIVAASKSLGRHAVCASLDDFYLTQSERRTLAEQVHPLFATRGVPPLHRPGDVVDLSIPIEIEDDRPGLHESVEARDGAYGQCDFRSPQQWVLRRQAAPFLRSIRALGYLCLVIADRPALMSGAMTQGQLARRNEQLRDDLHRNGARIDGVFPDVLRAATEHHVDLQRSFLLVGDPDGVV